jgi:hypothetical protein
MSWCEHGNEILVSAWYIILRISRPAISWGLSCQHSETCRDVKPSSLVDSYLIGGPFCLHVLVSVFQTTRRQIPWYFLDTDSCNYIRFHSSVRTVSVCRRRDNVATSPTLQCRGSLVATLQASVDWNLQHRVLRPCLGFTCLCATLYALFYCAFRKHELRAWR